MKYIALIAVMGILLLVVSGALPQSSVGGPLTLMLIFLLAMLAVGIHEAWSNKRGVLGWIVSIVAAVVGGFAAILAGGTVTEPLFAQLNLGGSLAGSGHPLLYVVSAGMMILTLAGSLAALWIVNRFR